MAVEFSCPSISKSWKIPHNLVIEALPRQGLITGYNSLSATGDLKLADHDILVYPGTMRYNPQVEDHGIIIGSLVFHGLLTNGLWSFFKFFFVNPH